jgi:hypothetical protein
MIDKWIWYWSAIGKYQSMSIRKLLLVDFGWSTDFAIINIYTECKCQPAMCQIVCSLLDTDQGIWQLDSLDSRAVQTPVI